MVVRRRVRQRVSSFPRLCERRCRTSPACFSANHNDVDWDENALNERRLEVSQHTRYGHQGRVAINNALIDHEGKLIDNIGWFWEHAEDRYKISPPTTC